MFALTTNALYNKDLIAFLTENIDDGYGKPFTSFDKEDQASVISDFTDAAAEKATSCCYQLISSKYVKVGCSDYFQLIPCYFDVIITNTFDNNDTVVKPLTDLIG